MQLLCYLVINELTNKEAYDTGSSRCSHQHGDGSRGRPRKL